MQRMTEATNEAGQTDRTLTASIKLYYDVQLPAARPAPLLIALHGYGASKRHAMREAQLIVPENFGIAALQGFHQHLKDPKAPGGPLRFGFGWLSNFHAEESVALHHQALLDLIGTLVAEGVADSKRIFLLGFSQTCALNFKFAFTHPDKLRGVVGICGGIPGDWETSEIYQRTEAAVFYLAGAKDEYYPPSRVANYGEKLRERATDVEMKSYDAAHEIVPPMRDDLRAWLIKHSGVCA